MIQFSTSTLNPRMLNHRRPSTQSIAQNIMFKGNEEDELLLLPLKQTERRLEQHERRMERGLLYQRLLLPEYSDRDMNNALDSAILLKPSLGKGGVHVAYQHPYDPSLVLKMDIMWLRHLLQNFPILELMPTFVFEGMYKYVHAERKHIQEFADFFRGTRVKVPEQRIFMGVVDFPDDEILLSLGAPREHARELRSLPTFYRVVPFLPELAQLHAQDTNVVIQTGNAELRPPPFGPRLELGLQDWIRANENWVTLSRSEPLDLEFLDWVQHTGSLGKLLKACYADDELREATKEFVRRAIRYSEKTGKIVDIIGKDNVVFMDGNLVLHDALYSESAPALRNTAAMLQEFISGKRSADFFKDAQQLCLLNDLANAINYVRSINALAQGLGMPERLRTLETLSQPVPWPQILDLIHAHWTMLHFANVKYAPLGNGERKYMPG